MAGAGGQAAPCNLGTVDDCGTCGHRCKGMDAEWTCVAGACKVTSCKSDRGDCNKDASDGCEAKLSTDGDNCGMCGNACLLILCKDGSCVLGI